MAAIDRRQVSPGFTHGKEVELRRGKTSTDGRRIFLTSLRRRNRQSQSKTAFISTRNYNCPREIGLANMAGLSSCFPEL